MSVIALVRQRINRMRRGIPFSISGFYPLGSRTSVQQAMSRLAKEGMIVRVDRGFYARPKPLKNIPSIKIVTSAEKVVAAWAKERGYKITIQGLEAAYRLGMQTQAPVKRIYWSNGPSREFKVGNETVIVQHKSENKLKWLNRPEGELLRGLLSLNRKYARLEAIKNAFSRLNISSRETRAAIAKKLVSEPALQGWRTQLELFQQAI
ncbi:DUF6088 family protein [Klebsiella quasipneumoniae]|uniref:DUF6088 family protein n=1 Tax=Klebsiella quasipneumoniae TaxID=1463165 RepID=UPI002949F0EB|nr:DUF6088 family protein [Klebsiella quasipneumoniae]MDV5432583.1 DUF6088 family protein [Klebsiella quasipneumoniae]HBR1265000.1 hypothetical protein [Klebsiella quasipneumoniae subsp. quasipneumoniae]